jgi:hypothetical protein
VNKLKIIIAMAVKGRENITINVINYTKKMCELLTNETREVALLLALEEIDYENYCIKNNINFIKTVSFFDGISPLILGHKFNLLFEIAANNSDILFHIGSDDYFHVDLFEKCVEKLLKNKNAGAVGTRKMFLVDFETRRTKIVQYDSGKTIGIRFYKSKAILEIIKEKGRFWPPLEKGLDGCAIELLNEFGYSELSIETDVPLLCGIKSQTNLHSFSEIEPGAPTTNSVIDWLPGL